LDCITQVTFCAGCAGVGAGAGDGAGDGAGAGAGEAQAIRLIKSINVIGIKSTFAFILFLLHLTSPLFHYLDIGQKSPPFF